MVQSKHQFSLYYDALSLHSALLATGKTVVIDDKDLVHRITGILRLQKDALFTLFNGNIVVQCRLLAIEGKKRITISGIACEQAIPLKPEIICLVPLLKRDYFEQAIYAAVECGASIIQPVITEKVHRVWYDSKDSMRMHKIMVAAAEQAKVFSLPQLLPLCFLSDALAAVDAQSEKIFFDPEGIAFADCIERINSSTARSYTVLVGPEGDMTASEKKLLRQHNFLFCALTPTVLRSFQALTVGLACIRSAVHTELF